MTERKPAGMSFDTWIDRQIRDAQERGEFDNLAGSGKPIPGAGEPDDEHWWVRQLMRREGLSYLPPSLALRKEVEDALTVRVPAAPTEAAVRELVRVVNEKIAKAIRTPMDGPPLNLAPLDPDEVVRTWRDGRAGHDVQGGRDRPA